MKTIILYATKNGAAQEIAQRIAKKIEGAQTYDLTSPIPNLTEYDCIIVGSSVYAGMMRKEAKTFFSQQGEGLRDKKWGIFISGLEPNNEKQILDANVPKDLLQTAKATGFMGGIYDPKKAGFMTRAIMKVIIKKSEYVNNIDNNRIDMFVKAMNG